MCLRGLTAMTYPCHGYNPSSTLGVGVSNIERSEILFLRDVERKEFDRASSRMRARIIISNEWAWEPGVGVLIKTFKWRYSLIES